MLVLLVSRSTTNSSNNSKKLTKISILAKGDLYVWGNGTTGCLGRGDFLTLVIFEQNYIIDIIHGITIV